MTAAIEKTFIECCTAYAKQREAWFYCHESNKQQCVFTMEYSLMKLECCYVKKARPFVAPGTLYCRVYIVKNSPVYHHLPDFFAQSGIREFRAAYFSYIETPQRMEICFSALADILDTHWAEFEEQCTRGVLRDEMLFDSYRQLFKLKERDLDFESIYTDDIEREAFLYFQLARDDCLIQRFTTAAPYHAWLLGDRKRALTIYERWQKKEYLFPYEQMLIAFIQSVESDGFEPVSESCFSQKIGERYGRLSLWEMTKIFAAAWAFFAVIFCTVFGIADALLSASALYCFAAPWYIGIIPAGLCAVFGSIAFRRPLIRLTCGKDVQERLQIDSLVNSKKVNGFAYVAFAVSVAAAAVLSALILSGYALWKDDTFCYTDDEQLFTYNEYRYEDIDAVYYIRARYNIYGDRLERPSYVIATKDGERLDLDGLASVKESEQTVIPLLKKKGFDVTTLDSDRELP